MNNLSGSGGGFDYGIPAHMEFSSSQLPVSDSSGLPLQSSSLQGSFPLNQAGLHRPFPSQDVGQNPVSEAGSLPQFPMGYPNSLFSVPGMQGFTSPETFQQVFGFQQIAAGRMPSIPFSQHQQYNKHGLMSAASAGPGEQAHYNSSSAFGMNNHASYDNSDSNIRSPPSPMINSSSSQPNSLSMPSYSSSSTRLDEVGISMFSPLAQQQQSIPDTCSVTNTTGSLDLSAQMQRSSQSLNIPHLARQQSQQREDTSHNNAGTGNGVPPFSTIRGRGQLGSPGSQKLTNYNSTTTSDSRRSEVNQQGRHTGGIKQKTAPSGHHMQIPNQYYSMKQGIKPILSDTENEEEGDTNNRHHQQFSISKSSMSGYQNLNSSCQTYRSQVEDGSSSKSSPERNASNSNVHFLLKGKLSAKRKIPNFQQAFMTAGDTEDCSLNESMSVLPFKELIVTGTTAATGNAYDKHGPFKNIAVKKEAKEDKREILPPHLRYRKQEVERNYTESANFEEMEGLNLNLKNGKGQMANRNVQNDGEHPEPDDIDRGNEADDDEGEDEDGEDTITDGFDLERFRYAQEGVAGAPAEDGHDRKLDFSHKKWFNADAEEDGYENSHFETAIKGKRSDPSHPFAITSPSFKDSAARAIMTTTVADSATIVTISIMSIGNKNKMIPKIINSPAAAGGIVSVISPKGTSGDANEFGSYEDSEVKKDRTSIMSKLKRSKQDKEADEEESENEVGRVDVNIRINDSQLVCHGDQKRWQCTLCPKSYTTKHNLVAHILDHSSIKPHLCLMCGKYFKQLSHLNTHMLTHDNVKPHICQICHKGFTQISHLKRHQAVHLDSKPYICDICSRGFAYPSELRIHKDKHIPGKDKCVDCEAEFASTKELREHMLTHEHRNNLTCKHCSRVFRFPSQLKDHMITHAGARPFICTECGMDFMKEHHLKAHQFTHTGLRPFCCPDCPRSFNQKANMVRHMLIHNAERAYKCDICDKTFTQPQTLKAHMVVHADHKPYTCKFCGKQFGRLHNLQGHMHMHNNSKPYVCFCGSSFTLKGNLNRHKKVKHGLNESTESMEEDAVNFLSSLSERPRDSDDMEDDSLDASKDEVHSPNSRSLKKGRKSVPRKMVQRINADGEKVYCESVTDAEENQSEEEGPEKGSNRPDAPETEAVSKYFPSAAVAAGDQEQALLSSSRRKRKGDVSEQTPGLDGYHDNQVEDYLQTQSGDRERDNDMNTGRTERQTLKLEPASAEDLSHIDGMYPRKRQKVGPGRDENLDYSDSIPGTEDDDPEDSMQNMMKTSSKGANLDSLIASKFSKT